MKRFPTIKNVLYCSLAAAVVVLAVPTNPHVHRSANRLTGAVPTMSQSVTDSTITSANHQTVVQNATGPSNSTTPTPPANPKPPANSPPAAPKSVTPPPSSSANNATNGELDNERRPPTWGYIGRKTAKLRVHVIDGRTMKPLAGAEVVIIETEQRVTTDEKGYTPWIDAPVLRNPKYRPFVAELHGQLGCIVYKNGYRDSIHLGIRMHEGIEQETTVWMYQIGPGDRRIEPTLYQEPYHHIWLIQLADRFRQKSQIGEGPERP